jgi:hypothetical protein
MSAVKAPIRGSLNNGASNNGDVRSRRRRPSRRGSFSSVRAQRQQIRSKVGTSSVEIQAGTYTHCIGLLLPLVPYPGQSIKKSARRIDGGSSARGQTAPRRTST